MLSISKSADNAKCFQVYSLLPVLSCCHGDSGLVVDNDVD